MIDGPEVDPDAFSLWHAHDEIEKIGEVHHRVGCPIGLQVGAHGDPLHATSVVGCVLDLQRYLRMWGPRTWFHELDGCRRFGRRDVVLDHETDRAGQVPDPVDEVRVDLKATSCGEVAGPCAERQEVAEGDPVALLGDLEMAGQGEIPLHRDCAGCL
jgi:hypothetical protein